MDKLEFIGALINEKTHTPLHLEQSDLLARYNIALTSNPPEDGLALIYDASGLGLVNLSQPQLQPVRADFLNPEVQFRMGKMSIKSEPMLRALGFKGSPLHIMDATPGLGRDAVIMAKAGCRVTLVERSNVVAALLDDGLTQLAKEQAELASRMSLLHANSVTTMVKWNAVSKNVSCPDVIYLDPMFPHRKKTALVKKQMQLFQRLLGHDEDADALLLPALNLAAKRVVVKRPNTAPPLAGKQPSMAIKSKKHRFDVYLTQNLGDKK